MQDLIFFDLKMDKRQKVQELGIRIFRIFSSECHIVSALDFLSKCTNQSLLTPESVEMLLTNFIGCLFPGVHQAGLILQTGLHLEQGH